MRPWPVRCEALKLPELVGCDVPGHRDHRAEHLIRPCEVDLKDGMRLDLADHILTPVAHRDHARSGGLCGPGRNGEDCATILNSLQTLPPFIPTNSKLKYSTLVTAETSLQFCAVLRSSAQFCAVLRSLQLADPDLAVLRSSNVQPRGHPVLTPSCSSGASQTPLTSCNTRTWPKLHSQLSTYTSRLIAGGTLRRLGVAEM